MICESKQKNLHSGVIFEFTDFTRNLNILLKNYFLKMNSQFKTLTRKLCGLMNRADASTYLDFPRSHII